MTVVVKEKDELRSSDGVTGIFGLYRIATDDAKRTVWLLVSGQCVLYFDFSGGESGLRLHSGG